MYKKESKKTKFKKPKLIINLIKFQKKSPSITSYNYRKLFI